MITTVTTSTVAIVTSVVGMGLALGLATVITLVVFLGTKELVAASAGKSGSWRFLARSFNVIIVPLFAVFFITCAVKVMEILGWI